MIPEGHVTLDSILEGILDEEQSSSSSGPGSPNQLSPSGMALDPIPNIPCISIKTELADSCSMDIMMDYTDCSRTSSPSSPALRLMGSSVGSSNVVTTIVDSTAASRLVTLPLLGNPTLSSSSSSSTSSSASPGSPDRQHCSSTTQSNNEGMHIIPPDSIKDEDGCPKRMCLVCGDVASGFHYGVSSCEACKAFFKRTIQGIANRQGNIDYTCPASNDCEINKRRRKACQACRFQKCLRMGMLKEGVRLDRVRGGRQKYRRIIDNPYNNVQPQRKVSLEENKLLVALARCEPDPILALPDPTTPDNKYKTIRTLSEYYDRELVGTIGWAKQIPGFTDLSLNDQMRLLQGSWCELLTLTLAFRSLPKTKEVKIKFASDFALSQEQAKEAGLEEFYNLCVRTMQRVSRVSLRKEEFLLLKAIIICNCDVDIDFAEKIHSLRDNVLNALYDCVAVIRPGNPWLHVQNLLLLLPSIRQSDAVVKRFWRTVQQQPDITVNKLLAEMLEAK